MASQVVSYALDADTVVQFEIEPTDDWHPAGADQVVAQVGDAVRPAVEAAQVVLARAAELGPAEVNITFGIKVSGTTHWLVAKAAAEANFQVALTWRPGEGRDADTSAQG